MIWLKRSKSSAIVALVAMMSASCGAVLQLPARAPRPEPPSDLIGAVPWAPPAESPSAQKVVRALLHFAPERGAADAVVGPGTFLPAPLDKYMAGFVRRAVAVTTLAAQDLARREPAWHATVDAEEGRTAACLEHVEEQEPTVPWWTWATAIGAAAFAGGLYLGINSQPVAQ